MVLQELALAQRASQGDEEAFNAIYRAYERQIYSHVARIVKDRCDTEDITQEVFLRAYRHLDTYSGSASIGRWLRRIATNLCIDRMRKKGLPTVSWPTITSRDGDERAVEFADDAPSPLDSALAMENEQAVLRAIQNLPEYYRKVVVLRDLMDCTGEEIAREIDCPLGTVKSRLSRAHGILRNQFLPSPGIAAAGA